MDLSEYQYKFEQMHNSGGETLSFRRDPCLIAGEGQVMECAGGVSELDGLF